MSLETSPKQEVDFMGEEKKILEGVEPGLASVVELTSRRPLTEKPQ